MLEIGITSGIFLDSVVKFECDFFIISCLPFVFICVIEASGKAVLRPCDHWAAVGQSAPAELYLLLDLGPC